MYLYCNLFTEKENSAESTKRKEDHNKEHDQVRHFSKLSETTCLTNELHIFIADFLCVLNLLAMNESKLCCTSAVLK